MNKPIIIDGVDVSECQFCSNGLRTMCCEELYDDGSAVYECQDISDCYYKQLQRLKEENEELKEELKQLHNGRTTEEIYTLFGKPIKCWLEYKQALEEVKKVIDSECSNCVKLYHSCVGHWCKMFNVLKILKEMDEVLKDE